MKNVFYLLRRVRFVVDKVGWEIKLQCIVPVAIVEHLVDIVADFASCSE